MTVTLTITAADGATSQVVLPAPAVNAGGFPNASNTGYGNTALTPATSNAINKAGTYSGTHFTGTVTISASNVTLRNCLITAKASDPFSLVLTGTNTGVLVDHCTIIGAGTGTTQSAAAYGFYVQGNVGVTFNACDISQVGQNAINNGQIVIQNCYIHDLNSGPGSHYECIYYGGQNGGSPNPNFSLLIQNNALINQRGQTASIYTSTDFSPLVNVTIKNNLLIGGSYTFYCDASQGSGGCSVTNYSITNNAMGKGQYGYFDLNKGSAPTYQVTSSGNYDYQTLKPVS